MFPSKVWFFLQQDENLEKRALASKLVHDWGAGSPRENKKFPSPSSEEKVFATRMLSRGSVLVSTEGALHLLPEGRRFLTAEQEEERGEKKMSSRGGESEIQHIDLLNRWLVAGSSNGILSVEQKSSLILLCLKMLKLVMFGAKNMSTLW